MFPQWVLYAPSREYPNHFVIREFTCQGDQPVPTGTYSVHETLQAAREAIPEGFEWVPRSEEDEPAIVEVGAPTGWGEVLAMHVEGGEAGLDRTMALLDRAVMIKPTERDWD
ncbi:hypothetical protein [Tautonia plasticadhaerens]|uniref:Uncharacterized protein n=1 Tax=Tautonia plasticadhaerens TaxID=2527974 RepID=A0A518GYL7_9BACT|nr:hypothetical protein [Tautonia plasticadhaerens]QDV33695.1 hypothetical protein ElP_15720 [Tautonia plasticadhaerens]